MLEETFNRNAGPHRIAVLTRNRAFTQVLERLLVNWGFVPGSAEDPSVLLLAEEGSAVPCAGQETLWMTCSNAPAKGQMILPVSVESLWQAMEQHFHKPPRMHMRMAVDLQAKVSLRGEWYDTRLSSLSDRGARFSSDRELVRQEKVSVKLQIDREACDFHGKVIFSMAARPADTVAFNSGVVFYGQDKAVCDGLRSYLVRCYLETVRSDMDLQVFLAGLEFFALAPQVQQGLNLSSAGTVPIF